jgi:P27 family predicted phage terminase small subunit
MAKVKLKCPDHLDKVAKAEWKRILRVLGEVSNLKPVDSTVLAAYCQTYSRWVEAEKKIQDFGMVIKSPKSGFPINSPYVGIANKTLVEMRKLLAEMGMTPAARSKIKDTTFDAASELEALMSADVIDDDSEDYTEGDPLPIPEARFNDLSTINVAPLEADQ